MRYRLPEALKTGNRIIDNEHRQLFQIADRLLNACNNGTAMSQLGPVIQFLLKHVTEHFQHEEHLLEQVEYPELEEHRAFHAKYQEDLRKLLLQFPSSGPTVSDVVNLYGQIAVLIDHVKVDDKRMCAFLAQKSLWKIRKYK